MQEKIWKDPNTNLIWQVEIEDKAYIWDDIQEYVNKLNDENYCGYNRWRVPTLDELQTLITENSYRNFKSQNFVTYITEPLLESMYMETQSFWSSTECEEDNYFAWYVFFYGGSSFYEHKLETNYIRCVTDNN